MLKTLIFLVGGVWASNSTSAAPTTTAVPDALCDPIPGYVGAGMQNPTCCTMQKTLISYTVLTNPSYATVSGLVTSCMAYGGLCVNTTGGDFTPTATAKAAAAQHVCTPPAGQTCVSEWIDGLYVGRPNNTLNALLLAGGNYTAVCDDFFAAAIALNQSTQATADSVMTAMAAAEAAAHAAHAPTTSTTPAAVVSNTTAAAATTVDVNATTAAAATTTAAATNATAQTIIKGHLTIEFTVPANKTAADLNNDTTFKNALASTIKKSITSLPTSATVVVTKVEAATRRARGRALASLKLKISYEITLPQASAAAAMAEIVDNKATFEAAVKSNSVAEFQSAGLTGYTVNSVAASTPTMTNPPPATTADPSVLSDTGSSFAAAQCMPSVLVTLGVVTSFFF
jgi:hypothetical protein